MKNYYELTDNKKFCYAYAAALLASIPDNKKDNDPALIELMQAAYDKEFEAFKRPFAGAEIASLEYEYIQEQRQRLNGCNLKLHTKSNRKKVRRYLKFLDTKEKANTGSIPAEKKQFNSLRRVYAFILAMAYDRGHKEIKNCSVETFETRVKEIFHFDKPRQIYQTVRSTYKGESNFINYDTEMAKAYRKDCDYAVKIFDVYYPKICEHFPKKN